MKTRSLTSVAVALAALAGCQQHSNLRLETGQTQRLPVLGDAMAAGERTPDEPSVRSLGRENWATITYVVPVDGASHNASWRRFEPDAGSSKRARGDYPTPPDALRLEDSSRTEQSWAFFTGPVFGLAELLWMPVSAITTPLWGEYWSNSEAFDRTAFAEPLAFPQRTDARPTGEPVVRASAIKAEDADDGE